MTCTVAIGASKPLCGFSPCSNFRGKRAFRALVTLQIENLFDFCLVSVQQVVDVPEQALLFSEVSQNPLLEVGLCGANVNVGAFLETGFAPCADF